MAWQLWSRVAKGAAMHVYVRVPYPTLLRYTLLYYYIGRVCAYTVLTTVQYLWSLDSSYTVQSTVLVL